MSKNKKIFLIVLGLVVVVLGAIWFITKPKLNNQAEKYAKEMEEKYKNDTYGGSTPEETLQLFITILPRGVLG